MRRRHVWACGHERWYEARDNRNVKHEGICQACAKKLDKVVRERLPRVFEALANLQITIATCTAQRRSIERRIPRGWLERRGTP